MRVFSRFERALFACFALVVLVLLAGVLVGLLAWHLRWLTVLNLIADPGPRPGETPLAKPGEQRPEDLAAWQAWYDGFSQADQIPVYIAYQPDDRLDHVVHRSLVPLAIINPTSLAALHVILARGTPLPVKTPMIPGVPDTAAGLPGVRCNAQIAMVCAYSARALVARAADPAQAAASLGDLDGLFAAFDPSSETWFDAHIDIAQSRDAAWLLAVITGNVSTGNLPGWQAALPDPFDRYLDNAQYYRRWETPADFATGFSHLPTSWAKDEREQWWDIPNRILVSRTAMTENEDDIIARREADETWSLHSDNYRPAAALQTRTCHRLAVLATQSLAQRGADGLFPVYLDLDLAAHPDLPPLCCDHDAHRLRIAIDPTSPLPSYLAHTFSAALGHDLADLALAPPLSLTPTAISIDLADPGVQVLLNSSASAHP